MLRRQHLVRVFTYAGRPPGQGQRARVAESAHAKESINSVLLRSGYAGEEEGSQRTAALTPCSGWWPRAELNHRHKDFQSSALPTELLGHCEIDRSERSTRTFPSHRVALDADERSPFYLIRRPSAMTGCVRARDPSRIVEQFTEDARREAPAAVDKASPRDDPTRNPIHPRRSRPRFRRGSRASRSSRTISGTRGTARRATCLRASIPISG